MLNTGYRSAVAPATATLPPDVAHQVEEGIGSAFAAAAELGDGGAACRPAREAFVDGWQLSMWVGVALAAAAFVFVPWRAPRRRPATANVLFDVEALDPVLVG